MSKSSCTDLCTLDPSNPAPVLDLSEASRSFCLYFKPCHLIHHHLSLGLSNSLLNDSPIFSHSLHVQYILRSVTWIPFTLSRTIIFLPSVKAPVSCPLSTFHSHECCWGARVVFASSSLCWNSIAHLCKMVGNTYISNYYVLDI